MRVPRANLEGPKNPLAGLMGLFSRHSVIDTSHVYFRVPRTEVRVLSLHVPPKMSFRVPRANFRLARAKLRDQRANLRVPRAN